MREMEQRVRRNEQKGRMGEEEHMKHSRQWAHLGIQEGWKTKEIIEEI